MKPAFSTPPISFVLRSGTTTRITAKKRIKAAELKGKVGFGVIAVREDEFEAVLNRLPTEQIATGHQTYAISRLRTINEDQYVIASVRCSGQGTKHGQTVAHLH